MSLVADHTTAPPSVFLRRLLRSPSAAIGGAIVLFVLLVAIFAPLIAPYDPNLQETANRLMAPEAAHWLGTDAFGRDILSRLIFGARPTLLLVLFVVLLMAPIGTPSLLRSVLII